MRKILRKNQFHFFLNLTTKVGCVFSNSILPSNSDSQPRVMVIACIVVEAFGDSIKTHRGIANFLIRSILVRQPGVICMASLHVPFFSSVKMSFHFYNASFLSKLNDFQSLLLFFPDFYCESSWGQPGLAMPECWAGIPWNFLYQINWFITFNLILL